MMYKKIISYVDRPKLRALLKTPVLFLVFNHASAFYTKSLDKSMIWVMQYGEIKKLSFNSKKSCSKLLKNLQSYS